MYLILNYIIKYHYRETIILFLTMQYYRCGVCCRLVECARDLTLLWAHTSFPPSWVCVCLHVFALFMHACLRSLYAETHEHVRLRLHYMYVFVCLCDPAKALLLLLLLLTQGAACLPQLFALTKTTQGISLSSNSFSHPYKYIKMCLFLLFNIHTYQDVLFLTLGSYFLCCKNPRALSCRFE